MSLGASLYGVALRKESVDRNSVGQGQDVLRHVALRKESVDRNTFGLLNADIHRRVALRKESVDRNFQVVTKALTPASRSPQGERG